MSDGRVFQSVGAATEKDLAPYVFKLKCGMERSSNLTRSCYSNLKPRLYFWLINSFLSQKSLLNLICLHYE